MRPADTAPSAIDAGYLNELTSLTKPFGVTHTGVTSADVLTRARAAIEDRMRRGLTDGMQFTFRNPARSTEPQRALTEAQSVLAAALPYLLDDVARPPGRQARVARYAWSDNYQPLRLALDAVVSRLRIDGHRAVAFVDDNSIVDREIAYRAGIGWFGKNANLLLPGAGSWFVLGCVITTAALPRTETVVDDGCGACRRCIDACPTGAIIEPGVIDAGRCLAWVLQKPGSIPVELRRLIADRIYGCDDCQEVCPPTVRYGPTHRAQSRVAAKAWLPLLDLLDGTDEQLIATWRPWYLANRDPRWIRRNALVVLGNIGDAADPEVQAVLRRYLTHDDAILREHAQWAAASLQGAP
ncbi:MAG: tRNA epoxyqueuosine(34) reductase QueG [Actinobacteria bacterium]|nr:tRNA epoxyqueuosine(34) reductase QueG [Actinomycetota bacterium]